MSGTTIPPPAQETIVGGFTLPAAQPGTPPSVNPFQTFTFTGDTSTDAPPPEQGTFTFGLPAPLPGAVFDFGGSAVPGTAPAFDFGGTLVPVPSIPIPGPALPAPAPLNAIDGDSQEQGSEETMQPGEHPSSFSSVGDFVFVLIGGAWLLAKVAKCFRGRVTYVLVLGGTRYLKCHFYNFLCRNSTKNTVEILAWIYKEQKKPGVQ